MAEKKIELIGFEKGDYISWNVTSQTWSSAQITISDENNRIFDTIQKDGMQRGFCALKQGDCRLTGDKVFVSIKLDGNTQPKCVMNADLITDESGNRVGNFNIICVEDAGDNDYNDYCVSVIGWNNFG